MKNLFVKVLILGALLLSTTVASPMANPGFDGGGPVPICDPVCHPPAAVTTVM